MQPRTASHRSWPSQLLLLVVALILTACGPSTPATSEATPEPIVEATSAPTEVPTAMPALVMSSAGNLVIWATGDANGAQALQAAAALYMQENPGITVQIQPLSWDEAHTKILAAAAAGVGPDIMIGGMSWGIEFGRLGGMIDLNSDYPELVDEIEQQIIPQAKASIVAPSGEVYVLQNSVDIMARFYRSDIIPQAPATWDELTATIEKVQAEGKQGFAQSWGNSNWFGFFNFMESSGGSFYAPDCSTATINSPAGLQALTFYRDLYTKYKTPTGAAIDLDAGLESGDYPIGISGSWVAASLQFGKPDLAGKWEMAALPVGPAGKGISFLGGTVIGIMTGSQNQEAAANFIRSLYTPAAVEVRSTYMQGQNNYYIPPSLELLPAAKLPSNLETAYRDLLSNVAGPPNCVGWEESQNDVNRLIQEVILNDADPQQALDQAAEVMNRNLE